MDAVSRRYQAEPIAPLLLLLIRHATGDATAPEKAAESSKHDPYDGSKPKDAADIAENNEEGENGNDRLPFLVVFDHVIDAGLQPDAKQNAGDDQCKNDRRLAHRSEENRLSLVFHDVFLSKVDIGKTPTTPGCIVCSQWTSSSAKAAAQLVLCLLCLSGGLR